MNPRPPGYESDDHRLRRPSESMWCSVHAALRPAVSHRVSDRAACPWRLYYTRYYTAAAISTGRPVPGQPLTYRTMHGRLCAPGLPMRPPGSRAARVRPASPGAGRRRGARLRPHHHVPPAMGRRRKPGAGTPRADIGGSARWVLGGGCAARTGHPAAAVARPMPCPGLAVLPGALWPP